MSQHPRDLCPQKFEALLFDSRPARTGIYPAAVYHCHSAEHASKVLGNEVEGYAYQRDGHPNADVLAAKCLALHGAEQAVVTSSGQAALVAAVLSHLEPDDHVLLSNRLYGGTSVLVGDEAKRWRIDSTEVDTCDLEQTEAAIQANTKMIVVETISNPTLRVADIRRLSELAHAHGAILLVDNTFATPVVCKPLELGADLVMESMTKFMNGHGDVILGLICGTHAAMQRLPTVVSKWGLASSPFDCWLAERGLETLYVRMLAAADTCRELSEKLLPIKDGIERIDFPGLPSHLDHHTAREQFAKNRAGETLFANMMTLHLVGGMSAANRFMERCRAIPYCPSLGETVTTLSHPASSSHRNLDESQLNELGMSSGTVRLSIGLERMDYLLEAILPAVSVEA
jgi:cystathionine beta-lyase/cystathionine gamma-synthase